jgi:hypothetical protein
MIIQRASMILRPIGSCPVAFVARYHSGVTLAANHALVLAPLIAAASPVTISP